MPMMTCQHVTRILSFAVVLVLIGAGVDGHEGHDRKDSNKAVPDFFYDEADQNVEAAMLDKPAFYDGDVASHEGKLWYAFLEFVPDKGDVIRVGTRDESGELVTHIVGQQHREYACPTLTADGRGRLWLSYEVRIEDQWDLFLVRLDDGKAVTRPRRVSDGGGADIHHKTAATGDGLWMVWQTDRRGQFDIVARQLVDDELQGTHIVGDSPLGDWHPSIAADSLGNVHVVWDAYENETFNVCLRSHRDGHWSEKVDVAKSAAFEGRADVVSDREGRTWIAWEEGGENWGKPYRGIDTTQIRDHSGPLHRFRLIRIAVLDSASQLHRLADPLPMPSVELARQRKSRPTHLDHVGAFYERSRLAVDGAGRVWLAYRHFYTPWLGVTHRSHVEQGWGVYARCYTDEGWSPSCHMSIGQGDGLQRLELAAHENGIAAVWTAGRTHRNPNKRPRGLAAAAITARGDVAEMLPLTKIKHVGSRQVPPRDIAPESVTVGEKTYHVFYGDLHRHTDLSLCRVPIDGTIDDAYRYAIEVAKMDFLGITDHTRDIARGNALSQLWWRCRKEVYRHQLREENAMRFVPFYAYERSHGNTADHNVISLRGDMLRPYTYPVPQFWRELDTDTMTIPHQPIRRDTWKYQNELLRPLVEIYQGCRDNSIEEHVHRGLAKGYHLGFIASSDHSSTSASFACVWAEQPTREAIFRALQARRTFAATDKIWLAVQASDHWMGEIIRAKSAPPLSLRARGTAPIRTVHLVVDGKLQQTWSPNRLAVELVAEPDLHGKHFVYFHLVQSDGNQAWSSPIWLDDAEQDTEERGQ